MLDSVVPKCKLWMSLKSSDYQSRVNYYINEMQDVVSFGKPDLVINWLGTWMFLKLNKFPRELEQIFVGQANVRWIDPHKVLVNEKNFLKHAAFFMKFSCTSFRTEFHFIFYKYLSKLKWNMQHDLHYVGDGNALPLW